MKKLLAVILLLFDINLHAISSIMNHRLVTSAPLLYKQLDFSHEDLSIEFEPWVAGMFDPKHTMANLAPQGKSVLSLDQQGHGDINPKLLLLASSNSDLNYQSNIELTPELSMYGFLFHCYKQFEYLFFDVKTAFIKSTTNIDINEVGGGNGFITTDNQDVIYNAQDAFTQPDWNYGKIGQGNSVIGFDNIQVEFGLSTKMTSFSNEKWRSYIAGFGLFEVPTGQGSTSEWLFEPQVGGNHWAFGFGADCMAIGENGYSFVGGGNYRHFIANWEKRSFDLVDNGQWSRYLRYVSITDLLESGGDGKIGNGLPGINLFTQDALIQGRDQVTLYGRIQKRFKTGLVEFSYNFLHTQKETIRKIDGITPLYGIYDVQSAGGITTAHLSKINEAQVRQDLDPVTIKTNDLNLLSGSASEWNSSMIALRLQRVQDFYTSGIGTSVDLAHTAQALSTWSVWANFEILLP